MSKDVVPIHGADHCPGGPDPIPCLPNIVSFRAVRWTDLTVPGASQVVVDFPDWQNSGPTVFVPLNTALTPAAPGQAARRVQLDIVANPGRYTMSFGAIPWSDITGTTEIAMHDGDLAYGWPDVWNHAAYSGGLGGGFMTATLSRIYPIFDPLNSGTPTPQISWTLAQSGGASEIFRPCIFEIHYEPNVTFA